MNIPWSKIEPNNEIDKKLYDTFTNKLRYGYAEYGNRDTVLPIHFAKIMDRCLNLEVKDTDVFITSYPKTGTTWAQEMVWMIVNNLDFERGKSVLYQRSPFLEISGLYYYDDIIKTDNFKPNPLLLDSPKYVDELKDEERVIKTHLQWHLLPWQIQNKEKTPKIIYTTRNPKDTCVSYYYHCILREGYNGDFETFCELFLLGRITYGHYYSHIHGYWQQRNLPNVLLIKYEDMKYNLHSVIKKVAEFLNKNLTDDQISTLAEHLTFENMKNNPSCNHAQVTQREFFTNNADGLTFMRSGKVGGYKKEMSVEMEKKFDKWIKENVKRTGITLYE